MATQRRDWDAFYAARGVATPVWSGRVNGQVPVEVAHLAPGTALDVGCGEGADAIWLARQGWRVTAIDPSGVALDRARAAAAATGVEVTWVHGGFLETAERLGAFDLVSVQYGVLAADLDARAIATLCAAVATGGTLLVVHHDLEAHGHAGGEHRADLAANVAPDHVRAHLDERAPTGWHVVTHERRDRVGPHLAEGRDVPDVVLRVRRTGGGPAAADATGASGGSGVDRPHGHGDAEARRT